MNGCAAGSAITEGHLTDAFTSFIAAADRLERSHWQLHQEVSQLRTQLEERNRALASSKAENDRMRIALAQILDALPCGVAVLETNNEQIVLLNPEARRLLEIPEGEAPLWTSLPPAIRTMLDPGHCQTWKQGDEHDFFFAAGDKSRCVTARSDRTTVAQILLRKTPRSSLLVETQPHLKKPNSSVNLPATWWRLQRWQLSSLTRFATL
jgi:PAS domain-containing protein